MTNAGPRARARAPRLRKMPSSAPRSDSTLRPDTIAVRHDTIDADGAPDERECKLAAAASTQFLSSFERRAY